MSVDTHTQAILLLTAHLGKASRADIKPLSPAEWGRFAAWLHAQGKRPELLLESSDPRIVLEGWHDDIISLDRLIQLLGRAAVLGIVLEKWDRAGLWVLSRSHPDYPLKLKKRLAQESPPTLVGCGNRRLLNAPSIAVVGSRDASDTDLQFTWSLSRVIADGMYAVISGGARGVDETAMLGCIEAGGKAIGILADNLLRAITSTKYRNALAADQIVLVTPYNPEAGFNVGNAMARNKYIYGCADAAVIVASGKNKGGTWSGAIEAMRTRWVPVWTRTTPSSPEGNMALVRRGALDLKDQAASPEDLIAAGVPGHNIERKSLFDKEAACAGSTESTQPQKSVAEPKRVTSQRHDIIAQLSLFKLFVLKLAILTCETTKTSQDISAALDISKTQADLWIKHGVEEGMIEKMNRPVRYRAVRNAMQRILCDRSDDQIDVSARE